MAAKLVALVCLLGALAPARAAVPGTFFWKSNVGLAQAGGTHFPRTVQKRPNWENINKGFVVMIDGYQAGLTAAALASMVGLMEDFPQFNPTRASFFTNTYRWTLRYLSQLPDWLSGKSGNYVETHKVYRKRFFYLDKFVPQWIRNILFFIDPKEWKKEEVEWIRYSKFAEPSFGKYYKYPSKKFNNWNSMRITETIENLDITHGSI